MTRKLELKFSPRFFSGRAGVLEGWGVAMFDRISKTICSYGSGLCVQGGQDEAFDSD
jgi:hypothetical protein